MKLTPEARDVFHAHALGSYPRECCGVLVEGDYVACTNIADDPTERFQIHGNDLLRIEQEEGPIQAILHSHCFSVIPGKIRPEWPTHYDMERWLKSKTPKPWGIVATNGEFCTTTVWLDDDDRPPLVGRQFQFGAQDCFSLVRDYFHEKGIEIGNRPRAWRWEERGDASIVKNYEEHGFKQIPKSEAQPGDVLVYTYKSSTPNHLAILTGPNTILQQLILQVSGYSARSDFKIMEQFALRYVGVQNGS